MLDHNFHKKNFLIFLCPQKKTFGQPTVNVGAPLLVVVHGGGLTFFRRENCGLRRLELRWWLEVAGGGLLFFFY